MPFKANSNEVLPRQSSQKYANRRHKLR